MLEPSIVNRLDSRAQQARQNAYAPFSKYKVGAAVLATSGNVFAACNVENASFGLSLCAERNAITKAVSEGETTFVAIVVITADGGTPCGACRQVLAEFCGPEFLVGIHSADNPDSNRFFRLGELLPEAFDFR